MGWLEASLVWLLRKVGKATEGLPTAANLQRQLDDANKRLDEVTRERDDARAQVVKLQAEVARLKPGELAPEAEKILVWLFGRVDEVPESQLRTQNRADGLKDSMAQYHLDRLKEGNYIIVNFDRYQLSSRGRAYVVENVLHKGSRQ